MAEINDKIEADMVDQKDAPASVAPDAPAIAPMNMIHQSVAIGAAAGPAGQQRVTPARRARERGGV